MKLARPTRLRTRLTLWYMAVLTLLLVVYACIVFVFQYAVVSRQIFHDEVQDVITVEGLLYFDPSGALQLRQDYYSRPQSHLLIDRMMEVRDLSGKVLYRTPTLNGMALGGPNRRNEGDISFDQREVKLADGTDVMVISHLHGLQGRSLLIRLGYSLAPLHLRMMQFLLLLGTAGVVALAFAGFAGQEIARRALRPLQQMADRAEGLTASNLHDRLHLDNPDDELGHLGAVINSLLQRLEQAFEQLRRFTADAAHELRTPLAAVRTISEVALGKDLEGAVYRSTLEGILEETTRLNETIDALLLLSRVESTQLELNASDFPAALLVNEVLELLGIVIEERQIVVVKNQEELGMAVLHADRSLLRGAFLNILHNALKFAPTMSVLSISYSHTESNPKRLRVVIEDQGPGIAPGEHERVFDRFFTNTTHATTTEKGTGLGLSIVKVVVDRVAGSIKFDDRAIHGARCIMELPFNQQP